MHDFIAMKSRGERIVALTAYDALFARLVAEAGADLVLVGDSLGQVVLGHPSTVPVTVDDMIHHGRAVRRGAPDVFLVIDMPFMSVQVSDDDAVRNCMRVMQQTGAQAVKIEGGGERIERVVARLVDAGIAVMGHVGLTPQSVHALGGYRVQGRDEASAARIRREARGLEAAGAFAVVLELVPAALAAEVTAELTIPTIGIGAGAGCDGQVLVLYDALGLDARFQPRFVKRYAELHGAVVGALAQFGEEVRAGRFPDAAHSFGDAAGEAPGPGSPAS